MKEDLEILTTALLKATWETEKGNFDLPIAGGENPIYRSNATTFHQLSSPLSCGILSNRRQKTKRFKFTKGSRLGPNRTESRSLCGSLTGNAKRQPCTWRVPRLRDFVFFSRLGGSKNQ